GELWVATYNGPADGIEFANSLGVSPDGATVFVTGYSQRLGTETEYATIAYDAATGAQLWVALYNGPGDSNDSAVALGVSPDGATVFVTGLSGTSFYHYATVAYDAAKGAELWVARYSPPGDTNDYAVALGVS